KHSGVDSAKISYNNLDDKPTIPAAQVSADWNATSGMAAILNKPDISPAIDYSTEEQWTGKKWIDGKKIYQKTITYYSSGYSESFPHGISNFNRLIDINFLIFYYDSIFKDFWIENGGYVEGGNVAYMYVGFAGMDASNVKYRKNNQETFTIQATIYYTCTNR
ncbi:MAG: hypothetical protein LBJ72_12010, partial [Dysgonamonadaceae bacterium]|nr:hypothetical protein [Dysgonamonadaceae bacterium]